MKIAVLSDCRVPTKLEGGHGLGRAAADIALALAREGHTVKFFVGPGSQNLPEVIMRFHDDETKRASEWIYSFDAILDISHYKDLSRLRPDLPVVNWMLDGECLYHPVRRAAVSLEADRGVFGWENGRILPVGIDVEKFPFFEAKERYLAFGSKIHPYKGVQVALAVHGRQSVPVRFVGQRFTADALPDWRPELRGVEWQEFIGKAMGYLWFYFRGGAGWGGTSRALLEAQASGTPALVLDRVRTGMESIRHCETGFVVADANEAAEAVQDLPLIKPQKCRDFVREHHSMERMTRAAVQLLQAAADGEVW